MDATLWACTECKALNPAHAKACEACGRDRDRVVVRYPDRVEIVGESPPPPAPPPLSWEQNAAAAKIIARVLDRKLSVEDAEEQMRAIFGP